MPGLADLPLLTAEFLAVDTETNGLAREACELTEVGAVLVAAASSTSAGARSSASSSRSAAVFSASPASRRRWSTPRRRRVWCCRGSPSS